MFLPLFCSSQQVILAQGDEGTFAILIASGCCTVEARLGNVGGLWRQLSRVGEKEGRNVRFGGSVRHFSLFFAADELILHKFDILRGWFDSLMFKSESLF